jgi:hypothetical protein
MGEFCLGFGGCPNTMSVLAHHTSKDRNPIVRIPELAQE